MTVPTNDEVREYLLSLGDTPDQVAQTLQAQGIKGRRGSSCFCPLAVALNNRYGESAQAFVSHTDVMLYDGPESANNYLVVNPLQIADFVEAFDRGIYPELDKEPYPS